MRIVVLLTLVITPCLKADEHDAKTRRLKIRVDDDMAVFQGAEAVVNTHAIPDSQWTKVYDVTLNANLLVITAFNQVGHEGILLTIDGQSVPFDKWKCNDLSERDLQNPEAKYPGVLSLCYDDSTWRGAETVRNRWGTTAGFASNVEWFWGGPQTHRAVVCRLKFEQCSEPTPAKCPKQLAQWEEGGLPVSEPALTDDCQFELKQCNAEKCFCVKAKSGARTFSPVEVPLGEKYNCSRKPTKCQRKRFGLLVKGKQGFIPVCSKSGHYEKKQCFKGECWCVKPKGGKERKNTRTSGSLSC